MKPVQLDIELFDLLAARSGSDLISIFIPTHRKGRDVAQNPIRFKNQLSRVDDHLQGLGWRTSERSERLAEAGSLLDDQEFWEHQSAALALYVDDEGSVTPVSVPVGIEQSYYVGQVFHLRYLVPSMGLAKVPILVLTKNAVRLFHGSKLAIEEVEADLPESFDDVNWFVDREKERQQHPDRVGTSRARHGHEPSQRADEDRDRFLRAVAEALPNELDGDPMVVLGDDVLVERFRAMAALETVSPERSGVSNAGDQTLIHDLARPAILQIEGARESEVLKEAMDRLGVGRATTSIVEALPAAVSGRVGEVVVARDAPPMWGRLDATELRVETREEPGPGDVDLIDRLVVESRGTGATVTTVGDDVEGDSFVASYRY